MKFIPDTAANSICPECKSKFIKKIYNKIYCSPECSNIAHVRIWRQKHKKICPKCNKNMIYQESNLCKNCNDTLISRDVFTLKDYNDKYHSKHPSWKNAEIRNFARNWNKHLKILPCQKCSYNHHVEICHIKPITEFSENTLLSIVNHEDNLLVLCPNCHWEFDNNLLKLKDIPKRI